MKNLSQIREKREDILTDWTVGDITERHRKGMSKWNTRKMPA